MTAGVPFMLEEVRRTAQSRNKKDIEKGLSKPSPDETDTPNKNSPVAKACCRFSVSSWALWLCIAFISGEVTEVDSRAGAMPWIAHIFSICSVIFGLAITGAAKITPETSGWRLLFCFSCLHLSTLLLMALGALLQRSFNVL